MVLALAVPSELSVCHSVSLFLRLRHAEDELSVQQDQGDAGDEVDEDHSEPEECEQLTHF